MYNSKLWVYFWCYISLTTFILALSAYISGNYELALSRITSSTVMFSLAAEIYIHLNRKNK